jgi:XTP/dITP diphosphohydrolase
MEILLASGNSHKKLELEKILPGHTLLTPADLGIPFDHEETGTTFSDNARGKALALHKLTGKPVLADDSGICVPALDGAPGIYSARYGSRPGEPDLEAPERNALLLRNMEGIEDRRAFFVCAMVLLFDEYRHYTIQETVEGRLTHAPAGAGGFGYDPLFHLEGYGKTMAELPPEEKNRISHRGKAGARMALLLDGNPAAPAKA